MKISYNWLADFIPDIPAPEELSNILTAVGLEVENVETFEEVTGNLNGLITGLVLQCEKHPDADKLKVTQVDIGSGNILQIVCGAANVAPGQKVVVALPGTTIYPLSGNPIVIKKAKIRGVESNGMICAEDEIGLGNNHDGIIVLPADVETGSPVKEYYKPSQDFIFEIGLTPNRIDAMSHIGVAKDVCAYLSHHSGKNINVLSRPTKEFAADNNSIAIEVSIENEIACQRYCGVSIKNITIGPSPKWMQVRLKSIGMRPVNNIVDITNYILHENGQPLHAFDLKEIKGNKILVKNLPGGTPFITLDEKERKVDAEDLMICNGANEPMCFGGVFGGSQSGVKDNTDSIFLESAWFNPAKIRRTSLRHNLRTDAATRFEKGVDISETANVLKRAAMMIKEICGGEIISDIIDVYPKSKEKVSIILENSYLKKISGKEYERNQVINILKNLGFIINDQTEKYLDVSPPFSKPDITLPVDVIEEIMRIDGFDNVVIPSAITITPALEKNNFAAACKENTANYLTAAGFSEIFTNSLTNSKYYDEATLAGSVKVLNSISVDLDIMRPSLMETGLESMVHNLNRKISDIKFFEFGNTYADHGLGNYEQNAHLCLYISGNKTAIEWKQKPLKTDFYFLKGVCENIFSMCSVQGVQFANADNPALEYGLEASVNNSMIATIGLIKKNTLQKFDIRQPVYFADIDWQNIMKHSGRKLSYAEIPKFPSVQRDLSFVVDKNIAYGEVRKSVENLGISTLSSLKLFDVFESEKLGENKKAFAINITFSNPAKTLTDKETDEWVHKITDALKKELQAEIRQ